ncbi:MAG TPA: peptide chain release factor N(5)-glutamine methyltransferase [Acidimicrobiales bacterium]|nr:peptide chain release factor N(5)-glutamine methyltransferase [Acidimicrobiales bacterium]
MTVGVRTWRSVLDEVRGILGSDADARWILEEASGYSRAELIVRLDEPVTARCGAYIASMVERRLTGEPIQYVLGRWGFRGLDLMVDRRVLIPRPETEEVVEWALAEARALGRDELLVADLGTGSGAIALSLAKELPRATVWATDASPDALDVARANTAGTGMWAATRVRLVEGEWWAALPPELRGRLDLVVTNPPYVADGEHLPPEVEEWEPRVALRAGPDGLAAAREVLAGAREWMGAGGVVVMEIAPAQAAAVVEFATAAGAVSAEVRRDSSGRERALVARWPRG